MNPKRDQSCPTFTSTTGVSDQEEQLKDPSVRAGHLRELIHGGGSNGRLVSQKIHCEKQAALDAVSLWSSHIEDDPAVPRAYKKLAIGPVNRLAMQDRAIADEFLKALRNVVNEIEFGEASQSDL